MCKRCMKQLKDVFPDKQLEKCEGVFISFVEGYLFKRKKKDANKENQ